MHRNAKRAMLFTTGKLRSIRRRANLRRMMRQEVAVDVHHLRRTRKPHQQQTGSSQHPQPQGVRGCISSALESFRQEVQVSVAAQILRAIHSMTHFSHRQSHPPATNPLLQSLKGVPHPRRASYARQGAFLVVIPRRSRANPLPPVLRSLTATARVPHARDGFIVANVGK